MVLVEDRQGDEGLDSVEPAEMPVRNRRRLQLTRKDRSGAGKRPPRGMRLHVALSILPGLLLFLVFLAVPMGVLVYTSLGDWGGLGFTYLGLDNFKTMFGETAFWKAARNTAIYAAAGVFIQVPLGCLVGIVLAQHVRGWRVFRAVLFLPFVISGAAYALVFSLFYNSRYGLLNSTLGLIGLDSGHDWLFSSDTALLAVTGTFLFILGFIIVLVIAEIASIPTDIYEAAEVDGASIVQRQWYLTVPLLRNVIGTIVLITLLTYLALFDVVYILTGGGPDDATVTLPLYAYRAYTNGAWGYANAVGVFILLMGVVLIVAVRRIFRVGERLV